MNKILFIITILSFALSIKGYSQNQFSNSCFEQWDCKNKLYLNCKTKNIDLYFFRNMSLYGVQQSLQAVDKICSVKLTSSKYKNIQFLLNFNKKD